MDDHKNDVNTCLNIGTVGTLVAFLVYGGLLLGAWLVLK
jgi:hypothetical protein